MLRHKYLVTAKIAFISILTPSLLIASSGAMIIDLGSPITASPLLRDLDQDGDLEILVSSLIGEVTILDHTGNVIDGWPQATALLQSTSPNVGDIDGDGLLDVVVGDNTGKIHAWELDGTVKDGFPIQLEGTIKSVVRLVDFDNDSVAEILVHTGASRLYLLNAEGTSLEGWPIDLEGDTDSFGSWLIASTPTVVDFDYDGELEIIVGTTADEVHAYNFDGSAVEGWPIATEDWVYPSISAVDLNGDYELEVITGSGDGKLYVWESNGSPLPGFPVDIGQALIASVAVADIRDDSTPELVVADFSGKVHCYSASGALLSGWPQEADSGIVGSPILIDVNGDGALEVVAPSQDNKIYIWNANGTRVTEINPTATDWIESTPSAGDLDDNGMLELVYTSFDGKLYILPLDGNANSLAGAWSAFRGDSGELSDAVAGDRDRDRLPDQLEFTMFGTLDESAESDSDGDGQTNLNEWTAGTDLTNASDRFEVALDIQTTIDGLQLKFTWHGRANRSYQIMSSSELSKENAAQPLGDPISCDSDELIEAFSSISLENRRCFYHVVVDRD